MSADPVDPRRARRAGPQRAADPAAARPRRPRRHAEVRLRRRPPGARAGQRPGDRGPGRARRRSPGVPARRRSASRSLSHVVAIGAVERARRRRCRGPDDLAAHRRRPGALPRPGRRARRWSPRSTPPRPTATPSAASSRCVAYGLPPGLGSPRALGPPARRPAGRRADGHPGDQGRRGRRRLRDRAPARHRRPTTRSSRGRTGVRRRTNRAGGIEGGMTNGEPLRVRAAMKPISTVPRALAHRRHGHRRARRWRSTSAPTCARCPPPASSPRRWWRWCSPTRCWRSSAATRVAETRRNLRGLPATRSPSRSRASEAVEGAT